MIGSLFSGIGGLELGLEWAGLGPVAWQCEIDPACRAVLRTRWPGVKIYEDVHEVGSGSQPVDIVCGGFPCQDVSVAGKGAGLAGARSGLWFEYARIVRELRPRFVVVENVAALVTRGLDRVIGDLTDSGYDALWFPLRAADVGAPHRRERIFIVAWDSTRVHVGPGRVSDADGRGVREFTERGGLGTRATDERDTVVVDVGERHVGDAESERRRQGRTEFKGRVWVSASVVNGCDLADADGTRLEVRPSIGRDDGTQREALERGCGQLVADADGMRQPQPQGRERDQRGRAGDGRFEPHEFPPGPKDVDGWVRYLAKYPGSEPAVCRKTNGIPAGIRRNGGGRGRMDRRTTRQQRLKMLGNAVVPQCGEVVGWVVRGLMNGGVPW